MKKTEKTIPEMPENIATVASKLDVLKKTYEWNGYNLWIKAAATAKYPKQLGMQYSKKRSAWYCNEKQLASLAKRKAEKAERDAKKAAEKAEKKKPTAEKKKPTAEKKKTEKPPVPAPAPAKKTRRKNNNPAPYYCGGIQNNETKQFTLFYSHDLKSWASVEKQLEMYALDGDKITKNATCKTDAEICDWLDKSNKVVKKAEELGYTFGGVIEIKPRSNKKDLRERMKEYAEENEFFVAVRDYAKENGVPVNIAYQEYTQEYMAA